MLTGELRNKVDRVWDAFWSGGIANPLTVIEQITYLLFIRRLDELHTAREQQARWTKQPLQDPLFTPDEDPLRWSRFKELEAGAMYATVSGRVFEHMKRAGGASGVFAEQMKGATFMIPSANLLERVVTMLAAIPMDDRDTKGDLYEYLLSKVATAGTNGQFRTPRHIIRLMVELTAPTPQDTICDPSAGSAGFLVGAGEYLRETFPQEVLHDAATQRHFQERAFSGVEFDATMIRIGAMNLLLHGIEQPNLYFRDALSEANAGLAEAFTLVLANPPFKGSLDKEAVAKDLTRVVDTRKTELLFLALILRLLRTGGRAAVIVPDGVLFGSGKAHVAVRQALIDEQKLEGVISMPSGVFKPYAGVSTAVLLFTKTQSGGTDAVWFYDLRADGYSLDDKRTPLDPARPGTNDIPDAIRRWHARHTPAEQARPRTAQSFWVPVAEIRAQHYDLSLNRYKETVHAEVTHDAPHQILAAIRALDAEREQAMTELLELLG